jgi:hypothetical protein
MIIVKLIGGLGNQLFQYALGRHLCEIHKTRLKIDISGFETYKLHKYSLWPFNIREDFASAEEVGAVAPTGALGRALAKRWPKMWPKYIQGKQFYFDPAVLNLPDGVYLDGYWQSEKYFSDIAEVIRGEFSVKTPPQGKDKEMGDRISSCQSVSLHIRRGDYVSHAKTLQTHGFCGLEYYHRCIERIARMVDNPCFFVFSDAPDWACENLKLSHPVIAVNHNTADKNYEDLRLMSRCKHHIIANSTFSWWGAWLNPAKDKIVIAPKQWFAPTARVSMKLEDLFPAGWILL